MYSPKIAEDLIPELYKISKAEGKPMTKIVDEIMRGAIVKNSLPKSKNKKGNH